MYRVAVLRAAGEALSASALSRSADETIENAASMIRNGADPVKIIGIVYRLAYMEGGLDIASVGVVQSKLESMAPANKAAA